MGSRRPLSRGAADGQAKRVRLRPPRHARLLSGMGRVGGRGRYNRGVKSRRLLLPLLLLALAPAPAGAASATRGAPAAQDEIVKLVLDAYEKTLATRPAWRMECTTDYTVDHAKAEGAKRAGGGAFHSTYLRDGEQVDVRLATDAEWSGTANDRTP